MADMVVRSPAKSQAADTSPGTDGSGRLVLLVGASGYIGAPLTSLLLRSGYRVRNLDLNIYGNNATTLGFLSDAHYSFVRGDLADKDDVTRAMEGVTDVVLLGGLVGDPITKKYPVESELINDLGIRRCMDQLNGRGFGRLVFVSTCSNYGLVEGDTIATEEHELKPLSLYAKAKVAAEQHLLSLKGKVDFRPTVLRFATAFGLAPRMRFDLTVNEFTRDLYLRRELVVFDAHTWRPYCHVNDFARLIRQVLEAPDSAVAFEVFNAGGDSNNHTKQSIVDLVCARLPGRQVVYQDRGSDPRNYRVSFEKVRERLKFTPAYSVQDGIDEIIWALDNRLFDDVDARRNYYGNYELTYPRKAGSAGGHAVR
jgi:nucleoside-diphosphate-sugar epimerase